jgi:hypothetical protein
VLLNPHNGVGSGRLPACLQLPYLVRRDYGQADCPFTRLLKAYGGTDAWNLSSRRHRTGNNIVVMIGRGDPQEMVRFDLLQGICVSFTRVHFCSGEGCV